MAAVRIELNFMESPFRLGWRLPQLGAIRLLLLGVCQTGLRLLYIVCGGFRQPESGVACFDAVKMAWLLRAFNWAAMLGLHGVVRGATRDMAVDWRGWGVLVTPKLAALVFRLPLGIAAA